MKLLFTLAIMLSAQFTIADSINSKKNKEEMLTRVDSLIEKTKAGQVAVKNEEMEKVCIAINELFKLIPDHLIAIGSKMDLFDSKDIEMENQTKYFLIDMHKRNNICESTEKAGDNLEIDDTKKQFKTMIKAFAKQKKKISKSDTDFENDYNYSYEFH